MNIRFKTILKMHAKDMFRFGFIIGVINNSMSYGIETNKTYKESRELIPKINSPYYLDRLNVIGYGVMCGVISAIVFSIPLSIYSYHSTPQYVYNSWPQYHSYQKFLRFNMLVPLLIMNIMVSSKYDREPKEII